MKQTYIVQTSIPIGEVREKLQMISPDTSVDYTYDVLFLDEEQREIRVLATSGASEGAILNVAHRSVDFDRLDRNRCPLCNEEMAWEQQEDRRCHCGFNWNHSAMWIEEAREEEESPGT